MKVIDSANATITSAVAKITETANGFLFNSHYYTKENLSPIPLEYCFINSSYTYLNVKKVLNLHVPTASWIFPNNEPGIIIDEFIPNRSYIRINHGGQILIIDETDNKEISHVKTINATSLFQFIGQNENYVYFTNKDGNNVPYIDYLDKSTLGIKAIYTGTAGTYNYTAIRKISEDDTYIYLVYYLNYQIFLLKLNKTNNTVELSPGINKGLEPNSNWYLTNLFDDSYNIDNDNCGVFLYNYSNQEQPIDLYVCNKTKITNECFEMKKVNITWNEEKDKISIPHTPQATGAVTMTIRNFISEFDGIKYLNVVSYQMNFTNTAYIPHQGIYTFRIDSDTELTFTGYNNIDSTRQINGFIYDESKKHLIISKQNAFQILKFNPTTLRYENTNYEITDCSQVGLDELQRVWYMNSTDYSVYMINLEDAQSVEIQFEKPYYEYTGNTISTYITFSAINYLNEEFPGKFELKLSGPAVFTQNSKNVLEIDYNGNGKQQIGITITGASPITVYPKFIN